MAFCFGTCTCHSVWVFFFFLLFKSMPFSIYVTFFHQIERKVFFLFYHTLIQPTFCIYFIGNVSDYWLVVLNLNFFTTFRHFLSLIFPQSKTFVDAYSHFLAHVPAFNHSTATQIVSEIRYHTCPNQQKFQQLDIRLNEV